MVLVLNCMKSDKLAESFDRAILRPLDKIGKTAEFLRVPKVEILPGPSEYSHVLISGSEASVMDDNAWDARLQTIILETMERRIPLLGICYGHQFIARSIGGKQCVKRARPPEFGWAKIGLKANPLFKGIEDPVSMVSHYDAVHNLPGGFKIIASTRACNVHGFQFKDLPVWGVQFHPEYNEEEANEIFDLLEKEDPPFRKHYVDEVDEAFGDESQIKQNEQILVNFFSF